MDQHTRGAVRRLLVAVAAKGYRCNTWLVSHQGTNGGFKVLRDRDTRGRPRP